MAHGCKKEMSSLIANLRHHKKAELRRFETETAGRCSPPPHKTNRLLEALTAISPLQYSRTPNVLVLDPGSCHQSRTSTRARLPMSSCARQCKNRLLAGDSYSRRTLADRYVNEPIQRIHRCQFGISINGEDCSRPITDFPD